MDAHHLLVLAQYPSIIRKPSSCGPRADSVKQVCGLLDYGVDDHHLLLVLPQYPGSLREWRARQKATSPHFLPLCLRIFQDVVQAVQVRTRP